MSYYNYNYNYDYDYDYDNDNDNDNDNDKDKDKDYRIESFPNAIGIHLPRCREAATVMGTGLCGIEMG